MTPVRLLVLGLMRVAQPVHGYVVRRELMTWHLGDWANVQPGSIYSAISTLEKDGLIEAVADDAGEGPRGPGRPKRRYRVTGEGEKEFQTGLREAWWKVEHGSEPLIPALCLMPFASRRELIAAMGARISQLEGEVQQLRFQRESIREGATGEDGEIPDHVREILDFTSSRLDAEIDWSRGFRRRLEEGRYWFADEEPEGEEHPASRWRYELQK
ncbi:helix-turn-helix transcriptional regulator [Dermatobacter hominis]|uniref:helix-turn-helix transcriptional regulator n=1 Tax=Dermatobacter hominis TaxID=2884263 RepID=UPI001D11110B|nr:helix-turn-helix transcriptional regulator [Dermatobacter hominis]UDY37260.1 PadR family transcriptional regulator [Dermatobacter hominis]